MPKARFKGLAEGYRSGLELDTAEHLKAAGVAATYEEHKVYYTRPASRTFYRPDFILPNGLVIETKGMFTAADRVKHLILKGEHPDIDLRFVFSRSRQRLSKASKTTYADWCEKHGFMYADRRIPETWLSEPVNEASLQAITKATK